MPEHHDPDRIAEDLAECRQRGLDWLDRNTSNQAPVRAAALQKLAEVYAEARDVVAPGRIAQIKTLLRDGIEEFSRQGHEADARLLRDLFFGESMQGAIKPAGELLRKARENIGDSTDARFRERRTNVLLSFARFLIHFSPVPRGPATEARDTVPEEHSQHVITGYVGNSEHFIQLLAEAVNVTIVGITNEQLAPMLQEALRRKRAGRRPDAFWSSLRIVFLGEALLNAVNDEREEFHDPREALRQRRQEAVWARRSVRVLLKRTQSTRWALYDCPYLPLLRGTLLEFPDRKKIVHLLTRRPRRPTPEHRYVELEDLVDQYFSAVFEDIVHNSINDNKIVPIGVPNGGTFRCTGIRLHHNVLKDGSGASGWLPMVLIVTSRRRSGHVEAMLQLRTEDNSVRELNRLSHLAGHIFQEDHARPSERGLVTAPASFDLAHEIPMRAAQRRLQDVTGDDEAPTLRPVTTGSYFYPDKEHLFFFVFALDLPEGMQFPRRAEMHSFPLPELLTIRANQVLRTAALLCHATGVSMRVWNAAAEVLALNLSLHDHPDLGQKMLGLAGQPAEELADTAELIGQLVAQRTTPSWASTSREVQLMGLAGWQYREFFSVLLPIYAEIGIHGAADLLGFVRGDSRKRADLARLAELYQDEDLMASMPIEL